MGKYIDSEKLIAEIERYKKGVAIARFDNAGENADYFQDKVDLCDDLTHIIDSLLQEQPEVDFPEVDFENEFQEYWYLHQYDSRLRRLIANGHGKAVLKNVAIHFCVLGLNARKEN